VSEGGVDGLGGGDPDLALVRWLGFGDALQDVLATLRVELGQDVVEQHHGQLADFGAHPIGFGELQREHRQALLTTRAKSVQVDAVEDEGEVVAVWTNQ
jgi:hypothetical protein